MSNEDGKSMGLALILPLLLYIVYLIREIRVSRLKYSLDFTGQCPYRPILKFFPQKLSKLSESSGKKVSNKTLDTLSTSQRSKTEETKSRDYQISITG